MRNEWSKVILTQLEGTSGAIPVLALPVNSMT